MVIMVKLMTMKTQIRKAIIVALPTFETLSGFILQLSMFIKIHLRKYFEFNF
jgi:hypothetical protein